MTVWLQLKLVYIFLQIILSVVVSLAAAAPQFLADTPEVNAAKSQFFAAYNQAFAASAPTQPELEASPNALAYQHENIDAEPYVHVEIPAEPYVHIDGPSDDSAAPAQQFQQAEVYVNNPAFSFDNSPVQQVAYSGGCYNWKGEGVPCRTNF